MTRPAALDYEMPDGSAADRAESRSAQGGPLLATIRIVSTLSIAIWLGSLAHLLLTVSSLFVAFPKASSSVAVQAAPAVFHASERFGLVVAAIALASSILWTRHSPSRSRRWIVWLLAAAAMLAVTQTTLISARMDALRAVGQSGLDAFKTLHGVSSVQYLLQTALLLVATALLPAASGTRPRDAAALTLR